MSESYTVGITKNQLKALNDGEEVCRRPYPEGKMKFHKYAKVRYDGNKRITIRVLSDEEEKEEPKSSFF